PPAGPPDDGALAPARRQEALTRTLLALAAGPRGDAAPLVLLLDDLQWAEPATLDVVAAVGRRAAERELPLLLLLTARGEALAAEPVLEPWLADLSRALPLARLALPPLAEADTRAWATALGPAGTPAGQMSGLGGWLHAETGGQPLYVVELLKALVARGALAPVRAARGWHLAPATADPAALAGGPPAPVRALLLGRLAGLPPAARALLTAAAVLGERATFTPLCRVAAVDEETALVALDHLLARRLLGEAPSPAEGPRDAGYRCTHAWLRAVVLADAGEARRHVFRRRALAAASPAIGRHDRDAAPGYVAAPEPGAYLAAAAGGA
ncbi:MAG TPA: hypothetical protein VFW96_10795, partial [Thermomicrobiales bacterium]|nr:hypothetical protein [Thermomicrobiales bacterium]